MSNDIFDDLTDEEKALLKRDVKRRIEDQRRRERPLVTPVTWQVFFLFGIIEIIGSILTVRHSPVFPIFLFTGIVTIVMGIMVLVFLRMKK